MSKLPVISATLDGQTPARLDYLNGIIYTNAPHFDHLPELYKKFILLHEEGHYELKTFNELEADKYAFDRLAGTELGSLKAMYNTMVEVLPFTSVEHFERFKAMYTNIMLYNYQKTGDKAYLEEIKNFNPQYMNYYGFNLYYTNTGYSTDAKTVAPNGVSEQAAITANDVNPNTTEPILKSTNVETPTPNTGTGLGTGYTGGTGSGLGTGYTGGTATEDLKYYAPTNPTEAKVSPWLWVVIAVVVVSVILLLTKKK